MPLHKALLGGALLSLLFAGCDRADPPEPSATDGLDMEAASVDLPPQNEVANECPIGRVRTEGACCWPGQSVDAEGECAGIPESCPEPLLVNGTTESCDRCGGSPRCAELIETCGEGGEACEALAMEFMRGAKGLREDELRAGSLFDAACQAGSARACTNWVIFATKELGLPRDHPRAIGALERACEAEELIACYNLAARLAASGRAPDRERSSKLLARGCAAKHAPSCEATATLLEREQTPEGRKAARSLLERACREGQSMRACARFASLTLRDAPGEAARALDLAALACEAGEMFGCTTLDQAEANKERIRGLGDRLEERCEEGDAIACRTAGELSIRSIGRARDVAKGRGLLKRACELGDELACAREAHYARRAVPVPGQPGP